MTNSQAAAFVFAQAVAAQAEILGMQADNQHRLSLGHSIAYDGDAFAAVSDRHGIGHNAVLTTFSNAIPD